LRRAGGKRCTTEQFQHGIRVILSYFDFQSSTGSRLGKQNGDSTVSHQHIELTQIEPNVFVYRPQPLSAPYPSLSPPSLSPPSLSPPSLSPPSLSPPSLSPPSLSPPSPTPLTEKELLDAEHASWYDDVIPRFSRNDLHRFLQMNRLRERWIRKGRCIGELPTSRMFHVVMKARRMFRI